jgi:hypothetical protein
VPVKTIGRTSALCNSAIAACRSLKKSSFIALTLLEVMVTTCTPSIRAMVQRPMMDRLSRTTTA